GGPRRHGGPAVRRLLAGAPGVGPGARRRERRGERRGGARRHLRSRARADAGAHRYLRPRRARGRHQLTGNAMSPNDPNEHAASSGAAPAHAEPHGAHAHDEHHEPNWFEKYFWSTDHKTIGLQYMITGML